MAAGDGRHEVLSESAHRRGAEVRLQRLLAVVPWVAARDGPRLDEVCARFGYSQAQLVGDLELLFLCGLHPYTPDVLIEVDVADGRVWIRYADYFSRPLRLTAEEGLALLAAGKTLLATPGADAGGPLARGLAKLSAVVGAEAAAAVEIDLGPTSAPVMDLLREAVADHRQLELEYYSFGRDEWTQRVVDPYAVFSAGGQWYLSAFCRRVGDDRLFRVDRIRRATRLDGGFEPPSRPPGLATYQARPEDPRVTLELAPSARWVLDQYPVEKVETAGEGWRVTMAVSERAWLERLLLRLGPAARVVDATGVDRGTGAAAAARLLGRYRRGDDPRVASRGHD